MAAHQNTHVHDVFFSYGRVDDQKSGEQAGWVTLFVEDLKKRLSERLGRRESFSLWWDEKCLPGNVDVTSEIANAIKVSACMLVILSPGYLKSNWCQRERNDFLKWIADREGDAGAGIFVIQRDWVAPEEIPSEFSRLQRYMFWTGDPNDQSKLPRPLDKDRKSDREEYNDELNRVAQAIERELCRIRTMTIDGTKKPPLGPRDPQPTPRPESLTVFLAEVTDDLRPQWKKLRSELDQRGIRVVSGGPPQDAASTEKAVRQALQDSRLFVQLLSQVPGQPLSGGLETYAVIQHRLAVEAQRKILQWRSPELTVEFFDKQDVEDADLAKTHRRLLFGQVRAEHFEDFKKHIVAQAIHPPTRLVNRGMAFVSFNPVNADSDFVDRLCACLKNRGIEVVTPLESDDDTDPELIRSDFERFVLQSQCWVVLYGDQRQKHWVRGQINEINQLLCQHERQLGLIHLCAGPPGPKDIASARRLVGIELNRMKVFDCQNGFDPERFLTHFDSHQITVAESPTTSKPAV